ncbi:MAG: hypothetical protein HY062_11550 [Bacteroidetes bacterium]|nr:hypothetical protein [Bacteroidota bacterium]
MKQLIMPISIFTTKRRGHSIVLSSFLCLTMLCQNNTFYSILKFKHQNEIKKLSNNPYKLITECFFNKSFDNHIIWGNTKIAPGYYFNSLDIQKNELQKIKIDVEKLKLNLNKKEYDDLMYYGFSTLLKTKKYSLFDVSNNIYVFNEDNEELTLNHKIQIPDSIEFNFIFSNTDSSLVLLDYRASFDSNKRIKAYLLNLKDTKINCFFETDMSSNSACFDKANTKFYDATRTCFLITDNLDYKIHLFNSNTKKITTYSKSLPISDITRQILNPNGIEKNTLDSISKELDRTARIINTQFINDTDIIVNYSLKPSIEKNGAKIKNSIIDLLTIRNDSIYLKNTYNDTFFYEQINYNSTNKINEAGINPYLRSELYHYILNNYLVKITFKQLVPNSNISFERYVRKAKSSIFNLKSNLIYRIYEFHF